MSAWCIMNHHCQLQVVSSCTEIHRIRLCQYLLMILLHIKNSTQKKNLIIVIMLEL